jgi:hypothetical protein
VHFLCSENRAEKQAEREPEETSRTKHGTS